MVQREELSETFVQKSNEFYDILVELYGKERSPSVARLVFADAKGVASTIRSLGLETVYAKAAAQAKVIREPSPLRTRRSCVSIVIRVERLSEIWNELYGMGRSRIETAEGLRIVLRDRIPYGI